LSGIFTIFCYSAWRLFLLQAEKKQVFSKILQWFHCESPLFRLH
jgi:hypothetical protein